MVHARRQELRGALPAGCRRQLRLGGRRIDRQLAAELRGGLRQGEQRRILGERRFFGSLKDLEAADARFAEFAAFKNGKVFNNDKRTNANFGNDYFESGVIRPQVILADLIKIFHPDLLPDHELVYYRQLE